MRRSVNSHCPTAVREADDPDALLLDFLQSTYEVAADLAGWDRESLERR